MSSEYRDKKYYKIQNYKDEYRLITDHIFFGDNALLKRNQFFIGINLALITIVGFFLREIYDTATPTAIPITYQRGLIVIPIIGSFISLFWAKMIGKIEAHLNLRVRRAIKIEKEVGYKIYRANSDYEYLWYQNPASWVIFIFFAYLFSTLWLSIFSIVIKENYHKEGSWESPILWAIALLFIYVIVDTILSKISKFRFVK